MQDPQTITEKDIQKNITITEEDEHKIEDRIEKLKNTLKDIELAHSKGLISDNIYLASKEKIEKEIKEENIQHKNTELSDKKEVDISKNLTTSTEIKNQQTTTKINTNNNSKKDKEREIKYKDNTEERKENEENKIDNIIKEIQEKSSQAIEELKKESKFRGGNNEKELEVSKTNRDTELKGMETKSDIKDNENSIIKNKEEVEEAKQTTKIKEDNIPTKNEMVNKDNEYRTIESRHVREYKKLKENWVKDLESLRDLYAHGVISEEEYEKSKTDIEEKISKIEVLIKRELEKEELEALKENIEKEIKNALSSGVFREEEEKYKKDLEALQNLYRRGLINKQDYENKKQEIEKEIGNYKKLIELVDAIFEKYIEEINTKVENIEEETKQKTITEEPQDIEKEKKEEEKPRSFIENILIKLHIISSKEQQTSQENRLEEKIKKIYKEGNPQFKISDMAMEIKKEVKNILGVEEAITYSQLIEKIKESNLPDNIKRILTEYFNDIEIKEYLSESEDKDIDNIYKETINIAKTIIAYEEENKTNGVKDKNATISNKKEDSKTEPNTFTPEINKKVEKNKEKNEYKNGLNTENITDKNKENLNSYNNREDKQNSNNKNNNKKGIFDKINEFFGV